MGPRVKGDICPPTLRSKALPDSVRSHSVQLMPTHSSALGLGKVAKQNASRPNSCEPVDQIKKRPLIWLKVLKSLTLINKGADSVKSSLREQAGHALNADQGEFSMRDQKRIIEEILSRKESAHAYKHDIFGQTACNVRR